MRAGFWVVVRLCAAPPRASRSRYISAALVASRVFAPHRLLTLTQPSPVCHPSSTSPPLAPPPLAPGHRAPPAATHITSCTSPSMTPPAHSRRHSRQCFLPPPSEPCLRRRHVAAGRAECVSTRATGPRTHTDSRSAEPSTQRKAEGDSTGQRLPSYTWASSTGLQQLTPLQTS